MKIKSFFYLHRSDRRAVIFLVALFLLSGVIIYFIGNRYSYTSDDRKSDSIVGISSSGTDIHSNNYQLDRLANTKYFTFDPNTADSVTLRKLGLSPFQIRNIYRYRAKGGVYHAPEEFAKIYGMTRKQYQELAPFIRISDDFLPASTLASVRAYQERKAERQHQTMEALRAFKANDKYHAYKEYDRDTIRYPIKIKLGQKINLANADTTLLKKVPCIGSGWAKAIVSYGKRLGGYVAVGQLKEIDNFPEEALPFFEVKGVHTERLNLNKLTLSQLRKHPYINFYQARAICDYRRLKGRLTSLSQLRLLKDFPQDAILRLEPYVCF